MKIFLAMLFTAASLAVSSGAHACQSSCYAVGDHWYCNYTNC